MTRARYQQISLSDTPYYHCISRCVRRAFLCGIDRHTGQDFSHRRAWVVDRLNTLSTMFAIDICAYAVMPNHYHLVLKVDVKRAQGWPPEEVIRHWNLLYSGPGLVAQHQSGQFSGQSEPDHALVHKLRERLVDISWYMRTLNEYIARRANAEDDCTGRFWEGRFNSQALLDNQALLTCMAYVDLNPIRAGLATTPETSSFTSICQRIAAVTVVAPVGVSTQHPDSPIYPLTKSAASDSGQGGAGVACPLLEFDGRADTCAGIPFGLIDYLALVDWSGRSIRVDKPGAILSNAPPILSRIGINGAEYLQFISPKSYRRKGTRRISVFATAIGTPSRLKQVAVLWCRKYFKGMSKAQRLFPVTLTR
jgi:REP element-mobilizing transposase RayT